MTAAMKHSHITISNSSPTMNNTMQLLLLFTIIIIQWWWRWWNSMECSSCARCYHVNWTFGCELDNKNCVFVHRLIRLWMNLFRHISVVYVHFLWHLIKKKKIIKWQKKMSSCVLFCVSHILYFGMMSALFRIIMKRNEYNWIGKWDKWKKEKELEP